MFEKSPENSTESSIENSFEKQFAQREVFNVLGGNIEAVDVTPEHLKEEIPILFAPGWGETPETLKDSLGVLFQEGRRVLSLSHARAGGEEVPAEGYPAVEARKAISLQTLLEQKHIEKIDAIAHSEGAINALIAASMNPEKFRSIVLVGPGGMIGKDTFPKLFVRFSLNKIQLAGRAISEALKYYALGEGNLEEAKRIQRSGRETLKYLLKNPILALKEAVAISKSDVYQMIKDLRSRGVRVGVIHGVGDIVFPGEKMQEAAKEAKKAKGVKLDGFVSVKGDHNEIYANPEKYTKLASRQLEDLAKKKQE